MKLALSTLCENPRRRTGLSTLFPEFVAQARRLFPDISWIVFAGRGGDWRTDDPGVEFCRDFASNDQPMRRLIDDHLHVPAEARRRGAAALLTVGFFPARPAGLPVVMQVFVFNHLDSGGGARSAYRRWAVGRGLSQAALIIVNSAWSRSQLGEVAPPVLVSPEGLRHDLFKVDGPRGSSGIDGKYLLWVSNLYPYKRIELALAAYAGLGDGLRAEFPLVVVGGDWEGGRRRAESEVARLGIARNVRFLGWVTDDALPSLYRGAHAHLLSTSQETFGRSVLEAMACGCPSVLQDLPVLREVAGSCGLYVDYGVTAAATEILRWICADPMHCAQLSSAGIERSRMFSFERLARERVSAILAALGNVSA